MNIIHFSLNSDNHEHNFKSRHSHKLYLLYLYSFLNYVYIYKYIYIYEMNSPVDRNIQNIKVAVRNAGIPEFLKSRNTAID